MADERLRIHRSCNLPRLAGEILPWPAHAARTAAVGFDCLYPNPWRHLGFSKSFAALKHYARVEPLLLPEGHPEKHYDDAPRCDGGMQMLRDTLAQIRRLGAMAVRTQGSRIRRRCLPERIGNGHIHEEEGGQDRA